MIRRVTHEWGTVEVLEYHHPLSAVHEYVQSHFDQFHVGEFFSTQENNPKTLAKNYYK